MFDKAMTTDNKLKALHAQLPNDIEVLRKYLFVLLRESADLGTSGLDIIYNDCVVSRQYPTKKIKARLDNIDSILVLNQSTVARYAKDFGKILTDYPRLQVIVRYINYELQKLGYEEFSYREVLHRIEKRNKISLPRKAELKYFCQAYFKHLGYRMRVKYNGRIRRLEALFSRDLL